MLCSSNSDLVQGKSIVADDEHVRIIPVPGTRELTESVLVVSVVVDDAEDRVPGVVNIIVIPSHIMAGYSNFNLFQVSP